MQQKRYDLFLCREASKWDRSFSTQNDGMFVHVRSDFSELQTRHPLLSQSFGEHVAAWHNGGHPAEHEADIDAETQEAGASISPEAEREPGAEEIPWIAFMLSLKAPKFQNLSGFNPDASEFRLVEGMWLRSEATEFIPMAGGWATSQAHLQAAAEAYQNKQKQQMAFAR